MKKISRIATILVALALVVATLALPTSAYAATKASRRQQLKTSTKSELDDWVDYAKGHGWKIRSKRVKYNKYSSTITLKVKRSGPSRRMKVTIKLSQPKRGKTKIKLYLTSSHARRRRVTRNELWAWLR